MPRAAWLGPNPLPPASRRTRLGLATMIGVTSTIIAFSTRLTPAYDSLYNLIWAREILHGHRPSFDVFLAPTQHPLQVAIAIPIAALGRSADTWLSALHLGALGSLLWAIFRLGNKLSGPIGGLAAACLVATCTPVTFLALDAYVDLLFLPLICWALVTELERPGQTWTTPVLLALAGLLRPDAWLLGVAYFIYRWRKGLRRAETVRLVVLAVAAPVLWFASDLLVTGDAQFSQHNAKAGVTLFGRTQTASRIPRLTYDLFAQATGVTLALAGVAGLALLAARNRRAFVLLMASAFAGLLSFWLTTIQGLDPNRRYVLLPSCVLMLAAAHLFAQGVVGRSSRWLRGVALAVAVLVLLIGARDRTDRLRSQERSLQAARSLRHELVQITSSAVARAAIRCGGISVPSHLLRPDIEWQLDLRPTQLTARPGERRTQTAYLWISDANMARDIERSIPLQFDERVRPPIGAPTIARSQHLTLAGACSPH